MQQLCTHLYRFDFLEGLQDFRGMHMLAALLVRWRCMIAGTLNINTRSRHMRLSSWPRYIITCVMSDIITAAISYDDSCMMHCLYHKNTTTNNLWRNFPGYKHYTAIPHGFPLPTCAGVCICIPADPTSKEGLRLQS
jgi:hypothetical protein